MSQTNTQALSRELLVESVELGYIGRFAAMASPCEVLIDTQDKVLAHKVSALVASEAWRIERKFSRYREDNLLYKINHSNGQPVVVDSEMARLLDFADNTYQLSNGAFDISSGVLRKIWKFDGSDNIPSRKAAKQLLDKIGWNKITWCSPTITLPVGMEIDLGGLGKEYAVDRAAALASVATDAPLLINFGGDLFANKPPHNKVHWSVGVDRINGQASAIVQLKQGGLASSGNANRFLLRKGVRFSHVLNPRTGWPVMDAPSSVTIAANSCIEAGIIATLAMLRGKNAEKFLAAQQVLNWVQR